MNKLILVWIGMAMLLLAGCGKKEDELGKAKEKAEELIKRVISEQLTDPESARFRNIRMFPDTGDSCGEVNSKNRMGGYVGYSPSKLWSSNGKIYFEIGAPDDSYEDFCKSLM